jgi:hypothetical protein
LLTLRKKQRKQIVGKCTHRFKTRPILARLISLASSHQHDSDGAPPIVSGKDLEHREEDFVQLEQAVEVTYDEQEKNHELLWV